MEQHSGFKIGNHLTKRRLIFGCGNPLFGDDGFGERVIDQFAQRNSERNGYSHSSSRCPARTASGRGAAGFVRCGQSGSPGDV
jgi:hypothetical protein